MFKLKNIRNLLLLANAVAMVSCANQSECKMGTYGYDASFLEKHGIKYNELISKDGKSKVMVVPAWQGRVVTTSASGDEGDSYGWMNYRFIESGEVSEQFNPIGGEERFWLGPEGGPFSLYFKKGQKQVYENWRVPAVIDTEAFDVTKADANQISFTKKTVVKNASETPFQMQIDRTVSLVTADQVASMFHVQLPEDAKIVAYKSENKITNLDQKAWTKDGGLVSIWMLGCFNPTPTTTVFIPYNQDAEGTIVKDDYFGSVPSDRLVAEDGMIYFKIDGKFRAKIGLSAQRQKGICGSYDSSKNVLTILKCSMPEGNPTYVNGQWGEQDDPFAGDVINSYNDGPIEDGSIMGPFYEIETSSPGAELNPGESLSHAQTVVHMQADFDSLAKVAKAVFGVDLNVAMNKFN